MIVVDTNILVYLTIANERTPTVENVLALDNHWIAPRLWRSEFRNALLLYMRKRDLDFQEALDTVDAAEAILIESDLEPSSVSVLAQAQLSGCSAYDCEFVVLAQERDIPLITADRKVINAFPDIAVSPEDFVRQRGQHRRYLG